MNNSADIPRRLDQLKHEVFPLTPVRLGRLRITNRAIINALMILVCSVCAPIALFAIHQGLLFGVLCAACFGINLLLRRKPHEEAAISGAAVIYRRGRRHWLVATGQIEQEMPSESMEELGTENPDQSPPLKIDLIGPLDFVGHPVIVDEKSGETVTEMGILYDPLYRTATVALRTFWASLDTCDFDTAVARMIRYGSLLDIVAMDPLVDVLTLRDMQFQGEILNPEAIGKEVRQSNNRPTGRLPTDRMFEDHAATLAAEAWQHRTTMAFTADLVKARRLSRQRGSPIPEILQERLEFYFDALNEGVEVNPDDPHSSPKTNPLGSRGPVVLDRRDLIVDVRAVTDPILGREWLRTGVAADKRIHLDAYDAYPGYVNFHDEWMRRQWFGCIKLGETYHYGLESRGLTREGLTTTEWSEVLGYKVNRTLSIPLEMLPHRVAAYRAQLASQGHLKPGSHPADVLAYQRAEKIEEDIASETAQAGLVRAYFDVWGTDPQETAKEARNLASFALRRGIRLVPLENRQHKSINAVLPGGRGIRTPQIPMWVRLFGYAG